MLELIFVPTVVFCMAGMTLTEIGLPLRLWCAGQKDCKEKTQARASLAIKKLQLIMNCRTSWTLGGAGHPDQRVNLPSVYRNRGDYPHLVFSFCTTTTCFRNQRVCSNCYAIHRWLSSPQELYLDSCDSWYRATRS
jgi:hypothetical protein